MKWKRWPTWVTCGDPANNGLVPICIPRIGDSVHDIGGTNKIFMVMVHSYVGVTIHQKKCAKSITLRLSIHAETLISTDMRFPLTYSYLMISVS